MITKTNQLLDPKFVLLEKQLNAALKQVAELNKRLTYLERENARRRGEVGQIAGHLNRK
jgi:regulator of replication initiation timing